jgi:hypothetical protein
VLELLKKIGLARFAVRVSGLVMLQRYMILKAR